jgi:antitoxin (DNA-binding transcriptional repressor) of toxin-antitoxin stability system
MTASANERRKFARRRKHLTKEASGSYIVTMRAVGLKILKNKLSEYVRLAAAGETVLITDRDAVVAEIVPPRAGRSPMLADAFLAEAMRSGLIIPPAVSPDVAVPRKPIMSFRELARGIETDREDR